MVGNIAMRQAIRIAVALSCLVVVGEARSSEMTLTGADLLKACTVADHEWIGFCNGYIQAAFDAPGGKGICAPRGVTTSLGDFAERDQVRCRLSFVRLLQRIEAESARSRAVKRQSDLLRSKLLPLAIPPNPPAPGMTVSY
jgi:hypothetical protein